jgi:hypothetical protein
VETQYRTFGDADAIARHDACQQRECRSKRVRALGLQNPWRHPCDSTVPLPPRVARRAMAFYCGKVRASDELYAGSNLDKALVLAGIA